MTKALKISDIIEFAKEAKGLCFSSSYKNAKEILNWGCSQGHRWETSYDNMLRRVKKNTWCLECLGRAPITIELCKDLAIAKSGACLSDVYEDSNSDLKWRCNLGHEWSATYSNVSRTSWCPVCAKNRLSVPKKYTLLDCVNFANDRRGKCLSKFYKNTNENMEWECEKNHVFYSRFSTLLQGAWCARCKSISNIICNRLTYYERIKKLSEAAGYKYLNLEYIDAKSLGEWECSEGHKFKLSHDYFTQNLDRHSSMCKTCNGRLPIKIEDCQKIAISKGGLCHSVEYYNSATLMAWECSNGHEWRAVFGSIKNGTWCPDCAIRRNADNQRGCLQDCFELAATRNGKCLSSEYIKSNSKYKWECEYGHTWMAVYSSVKQGAWCPECVGKKKVDISECVEYAKLKGGKCLSKSMKGVKSFLTWKCSYGHKWKSTFDNIKNNEKWCPDCANKIRGDKQRLTVEDCRDLAEHNGGTLISNEYTVSGDLYIWQCSNGHQWQATHNNIKRGKWCPYCKQSVGEEITRQIFEYLFSEKFPKIRPTDLINPLTNMKLELDGFSEKLKIAFEHQGEQHLKYIEYFHGDYESFDRQVKRDELKKEYCKSKNIILIHVPQIDYNSNHCEIVQLVIDDLETQGIKVNHLSVGFRLDVKRLRHK